MKKLDAVQSDMSRGMTLRNASENRRLMGHLQHLDLQLHQNLVSLQAEIMDLKLSKYKKRPTTTQLGKLPLGATMSDPRQVRVPRHQQPSALHKNSTSSGHRMDISPAPFLPQINATQTGLVGKRLERCERPKAANARRSTGVVNGYMNHSLTGNNLYKPKSTPDLRTSSTESSLMPSPPKGKKPPLVGEQAADQLKSRSSEDFSTVPTVNLSDRVSDFLLRPNTSSGDRDTRSVKKGTLRRSSSEEIPTIKIEEPPEEPAQNETNRESGSSVENDKAFVVDEELFRNSLLLKASRDDGLSGSMPDLRSLGFMDFNEVIDERLRKLQEEIPSEEEMRKIRYLRFRDEPAPPSILSVFDKESHAELEKIDE